MITKQELQELLDNVDENKLNSTKMGSIMINCACTAEGIKSILHYCQRELTLHDELTKMGYGLYSVIDNYYYNEKNKNTVHIYVDKISFYKSIYRTPSSDLFYEKYTNKQIITWIKNMENLVNMESKNG
jgi:hypothetical protein